MTIKPHPPGVVIGHGQHQGFRWNILGEVRRKSHRFSTGFLDDGELVESSHERDDVLPDEQQHFLNGIVGHAAIAEE